MPNTGQPGPRGGLSSVTDPAHFPSSWDSLAKKTLAQEVLLNTSVVAASGDTYTEPREVGQCEGFTIYVFGTGDWNVQFTPDPNNNESAWLYATGTDYTDTGYLATTSRHPWVRVVVRDGAQLIVWIYKKYATY